MKQNVKELIILDYRNSAVHIYTCAADVNIDEDYIKNLGHSLKDVSWMVSEDLTYFKHKGILI